jgi:hypothetical protein
LHDPKDQPQDESEQPQAVQNQPQDTKKNPGKPPEYFKARREALAAQKQARVDRMQQYKAARAAAEEKAYQEWHERYLADAPVREQYYRAQANAYLYDAAFAYPRAAYVNYWAPPVVIVPVVPVYFFPHDYIYWAW